MLCRSASRYIAEFGNGEWRDTGHEAEEQVFRAQRDFHMAVFSARQRPVPYLA